MEKIIYDLRLNVKYSGCKQQIELQKGETNARIFRMELCDGTDPIKLDTVSQTAVIRAVKADGKMIYDTASIKNGKAEYTLTTQDSAAVGTTWYELQIIDNGKLDDEKKVLYTAQFKAVVKETAVDDGKITSSDNFNRLDQIIRDNEEWLEQSKKDIDKRTLVYDSELVLTAASNTTPDKVHNDYYGADLLTFTSPWFTRDCDFIEIKNESKNNICSVVVLDSTGKERQIAAVTSGTQKVDLNVTNNITYKIVIGGMGPFDADITKFKLCKYKYISAVIDDVNKKHKEDINQVYAKHNTDFETIRQQVIKRVKFYSTIKNFIEEMLKMPGDTSLYTSIHVVRDFVTPILYVRYIDSGYNDFKYVSNESFYEKLSTGVKIGYYYIAAASEPRTFNYDVLSKIVSVPYTKTEVRELLNAIKEETSGKVDKENGKSLIDDNEIERLKKVNNYDDTNIKKQFNDEIEKLKGTLIENTVSGTECVVDDSADMPIQELHLYGKSEQPVTTGAQLFDVNNKLNWNSVFSVDSEGWISANIPANNGTTDIYYTFDTKKSDLLKPSTSYLAVMEFGMTLLDKLSLIAISPNVGTGNKSQFGGYTSFTKQSVIPVETINSFENSNVMCKGYIQAKPGFAGGQVKFRFSLIEDTSVTIDTFKYESYTGGKASPNPEYPQEIKQIENPTVSVAGKNLLIPSIPIVSVNALTTKISYINQEKNKIKFKITENNNETWKVFIFTPIKYLVKDIKPNTRYTIVLKNSSNISAIKIATNSSSKVISDAAFFSDNQAVITTKKDVTNNTSSPLGLYITLSTTAVGVTSGFDDIAVYEGEYPNAEIEEYKEIQTAQLTYELNGIDNVRDELIVRADGTGQMIQRTKMYDCSQIARNLGVDPNNKYYYLASIDKGTTHASKVVSSHFTSKTFNAKWGNVFKVNGSFYFGKQEAPESITDEDAMKQWLIGNKVKILFQLEEPIVTDLTAEEVQKVLALHTYKPVSTIWNDQDADMKITYVADAKNYIDNKLAEIQALTLEGGN